MRYHRSRARVRNRKDRSNIIWHHSFWADFFVWLQRRMSLIGRLTSLRSATLFHASRLGKWLRHDPFRELGGLFVHWPGMGMGLASQQRLGDREVIFSWWHMGEFALCIRKHQHQDDELLTDFSKKVFGFYVQR